jgi:LuxR family transcriptional regulator, maltose regulon positive regulatory protein
VQVPSRTKKRSRRPSLPFRHLPDAGNNSAIVRPSLLDRFTRAPKRSVFLLHAPAGFGKTYVLADCARRARRRGWAIAWLNLKRPERDVEILTRAIVDALKVARVAAALPGASAKKAERIARAQACAEELASAIGGQPKPVLLVLDDYAQAESEEVSAFLQTMFEQMPRNLTVALASRGPPRLALARLLLEGRLVRLDKTALAFTLAQTREFFASSLSGSDLATVQELTEGWPAALRMAELCRPAWRAAKGDLTNCTTFIELFTEYALAEVLGDVDERLADFLTAASIVETIEPTLADAIAGNDDGARLLATLVSNHSILHATDGKANTWRIPTLLQLALRGRLMCRGASYVHDVNFRAAAWYESQGRLVESTRHYVAAGKPDMAAMALERIGPMTIILKEGDEYIAALLDLLPSEQLAASPRLALCRLFLDYKRGFVTETRHQYEEISRRTAGFTVDREGGNDMELKTEAAFLDLAMQVYQRSSVGSTFLRSVEERLGSVERADVLALTIKLVLSMLFKLRGELDLAANALVEAEKMSAKLSSAWAMVWVRQHFGALALARGHLHDARHELQIGLKMWRTSFRANLPYRALTYILLAEIDYECNALAESQSKLDEALHSAEHIEGWHELYASLYETAAMLALHREGREQAHMLLSRAEGTQRIRGLLKNLLPAMRMRISVLSGDFERAREIAEKHRFAQVWADPDSLDELSWREWDLIGIALSQLAVQAGDLQHAGEILDRMYQAVRLSGRLRAQVRVDIMRADICRRREQHSSAVRYFTQAVETGATQGYLRTFLDEPDRVRPLLATLDAVSGETTAPHLAAFAARLGRALPRGTEQPRESELLSSREREVMHELSLGHSNKLIARKLGLSEPTVKFHVQNIFRKLDVRKRASAVAEAHRKGFLS